jgi:hypothetical protein
MGVCTCERTAHINLTDLKKTDTSTNGAAHVPKLTMTAKKTKRHDVFVASNGTKFTSNFIQTQ